VSTAQQQNRAGFERIFNAMFRLETITNYVGPLLEAWTNVLVEDNRRGVMQGIDGEGKRMKPTKYRTSLRQTDAGQAGDKFFDIQGEAFSNVEGAEEFHFANLTGQTDGVGFKPGPSGNISQKEYRKLTGPPLAPRGPASRVISNYTVAPITGNANVVGVEGGWDDVVSEKGVEFLPFHFNGTSRLPRRNLIGLRAWGKSQARKELNAWVKWLLTVAQPEYFGRKAKHSPKYVTMRRGSR
jgi:hypothetical protein